MASLPLLGGVKPCQYSKMKLKEPNFVKSPQTANFLLVDHNMSRILKKEEGKMFIVQLVDGKIFMSC